MKSHRFKQNVQLVVIAVVFSCAFIAFAEAKKPKYSVKDVMKAIHKGEDNIGKRVSKGEASQEDIAKMVEYYESLPLSEPPRGEPESWTVKTATLVKSARALKSGEAGALDAYKAASNCKACHNVHKPE
jgi:hypothetical protein